MPANFLDAPMVSATDYCTKPNLRKSLLLKHKISEDDLEFMVQLFFGSQVAFKVISIGDINTYMSDKTCDVDSINLNVDYTANNNNEITLVAPTLDSEFSFAFFQAIIEQFSPSAFHFSKGISYPGDEGNTLVFRVIKTVNQVDTIVYCGDLSGLKP